MLEPESRPEFDLGAFRFAVAKYVKLLIRARWRDDPGFLGDQALKDWGLHNINDNRLLDNRIPSWRLLEEAAEALGILNTEYLPRCPSGGLMVVTKDTPEGRLVDEIAFLAVSYGGGPYHNHELLTAAKSIREGHAIDWTTLVNWPKLPAIRVDLDKLPHPRRGEAANHAGRNVFRWRVENEMWEVIFDGRPIFLPERVGLFYLYVLLNSPGKIITASELRRAYASWSTDPGSPHWRYTEHAVIAGHGERDEGKSNEGLGSPGQDLGEVLDDEARANLKSRVAELPAEIESLRSQGKTALADDLERDFEELKRADRASQSFGGRPKKSADVRKRSQDAVRTAIKRALEELRTAQPLLHDHLQLSLKFGSNCCYRPKSTVAWNR